MTSRTKTSPKTTVRIVHKCCSWFCFFICRWRTRNVEPLGMMHEFCRRTAVVWRWWQRLFQPASHRGWRRSTKSSLRDTPITTCLWAALSVCNSNSYSFGFGYATTIVVGNLDNHLLLLLWLVAVVVVVIVVVLYMDCGGGGSSSSSRTYLIVVVVVVIPVRSSVSEQTYKGVTN